MKNYQRVLTNLNEYAIIQVSKENKVLLNKAFRGESRQIKLSGGKKPFIYFNNEYPAGGSL